MRTTGKYTTHDQEKGKTTTFRRPIDPPNRGGTLARAIGTPRNEDYLRCNCFDSTNAANMGNQ